VFTGLDHVKSDASAETFVRLFAVHQRRIYSYVLTLVPNHSDADDILQETSIILWRKFAEFDLSTNFVAWACRIAYFEILRHRRTRQPKVGLPNGLFDLLASEALERSTELERRHQALAYCIEKLHARDRQLLARRYGTGATIRSIAEEIGRSVEGLHKVYQRIRRSLVDCVDRALAREYR